MGTTYAVVIDLSTKGSLTPRVDEAKKSLVNADHAAGQFMRSLQSMGSRAMRPIDAVVGKIYEVGSAAAKIGVAGAFGLATYGVVKYNNELEKTRIQLGAIFNAAGASSSITAGLDMADKTMVKMRKDAAALPGEFSDLMNIFTMISTPGFQSGANVDQLRNLSAKIMATGATVGMPLDQVAREAAMLIEGRAGAHNVFGMRVAGLGGAKAQEFNKLDPAERMKRLNAELNRFAPAIDVYKTSFEGLSTTLVDNAKMTLGKITEPLFARVKSSLMWINDWFDSNETWITTKAQAIGSKLVYAFDEGKAALEEWWPAIQTFGENAYAKLVEVWKDVGPTLSSVGSSIREFLKDPGSIDKIITALKLYAGIKIGGSVVSGAMGFAGDAGQMLSAAKSMGWIGQAAGAAGSSAGMISSLGSAAAAAAPYLLALGANIAAWSMAWDQWRQLSPELAKFRLGVTAMGGTHLLNNEDSLARERYARNLAISDHASRMAGEMSAAAYASESFQHVMNNAVAAGDNAGAMLMMLAASADTAAGSIGAIASAAAAQSAKNDQMALDYLSSMTGATTTGLINGAFEAAQKAQTSPRHGGGGGGTTVQKVEIVVTSNQDPSRVARATLSAIQDLQRHPRIARGVPNYSASR